MRANRRKVGLRTAAFTAVVTLTLPLTAATDAYGYSVESEYSNQVPSEQSDPFPQQTSSNTAPAPTEKSRPARPKGNPGNWVPKSAYPRINCCRGCPEGVVGFTLTIGKNGRPTKCEITSSSGHYDLDAATCPNLMKRARFEPATDSYGYPIESYYSNRVRWEQPRNTAPSQSIGQLPPVSSDKSRPARPKSMTS